MQNLTRVIMVMQALLHNAHISSIDRHKFTALKYRHLMSEYYKNDSYPY